MIAETIDHVQFAQYIAGDKPVLVDFWAPWCTYCRRITPAFEKIAQQWESTLTAVTVNIDDQEALADEQGIEIIPTLVLYQKGKALGRTVAPDSKAAIDQFIRETLKGADIHGQDL